MSLYDGKGIFGRLFVFADSVLNAQTESDLELNVENSLFTLSDYVNDININFWTYLDKVLKDKPTVFVSAISQFSLNKTDKRRTVINTGPAYLNTDQTDEIVAVPGITMSRSLISDLHWRCSVSNNKYPLETVISSTFKQEINQLYRIVNFLNTIYNQIENKSALDNSNAFLQMLATSTHGILKNNSLWVRMLESIQRTKSETELDNQLLMLIKFIFKYWCGKKNLRNFDFNHGSDYSEDLLSIYTPIDHGNLVS